MAGHLHHHGVHAPFHHHRQQRLQVGRLGRGQRARQVLAPRSGCRRCRSVPRPGPAARRPASTRYVVVVLPDVPVTPITRRCCDGLPYTAAASPPSTDRGSGWTSTGTADVGAHVGDSVRIGEHRDRAARDGVVRIAPAVRRRARQRGEQVPRLGVLAAQRHAGDE